MLLTFRTIFIKRNIPSAVAFMTISHMFPRSATVFARRLSSTRAGPSDCLVALAFIARPRVLDGTHTPAFGTILLVTIATEWDEPTAVTPKNAVVAG